MGVMHLSYDFAAPADRVFESFTDFPTMADRIACIQHIEMLTNDPIGVGTKFSETRTVMGKQATETFQVVEFEPGRKLRLDTESCGVRYESTYTLTPTADGTHIDFAMHTKPLTLYAKIMSPIMGLMMGGMMKKLINQDFLEHKQAVETP